MCSLKHLRHVIRHAQSAVSCPCGNRRGQGVTRTKVKAHLLSAPLNFIQQDSIMSSQQSCWMQGSRGGDYEEYLHCQVKKQNLSKSLSADTRSDRTDGQA
jgi:hypothetical protein